MQAIAADPEVMAIMEEVKVGGIGAAMRHMNNPALLAKIMPAMNKIMADPAAAAALGNMMGSMGGMGGLGGMFGGGN